MPERRSTRGGKSTKPTRPVSPARWAAFRVLERVANTDDHSDDLLHGPLLAGLSQPDRNLATALVMGTLRWQLALEGRLLPLLSRPDEPLPSPVANALRLGAFQLLHMDRIPAHAALSESVELVRAAGHPGAAGLVNAVLRKLAAHPEGPRKPLVETPAAMAERLAHPAWLVQRWTKAYGRAAAEAICAYDLTEPAPAEIFPEDPVLPAIDPGSRLIAELAAAAQPSARRLWDACAAPGNKTAILAHRFPEAEILATDISPRRLARMAERFAATFRDRIRTQQADAGQLPATEGPFDLILCDAPCSGTGTLARNPEIKSRLDPEDLPRQATRQQDILRGALPHLALGGRLLYSTCSLEPEENERVVAAALANSSTVRLVPIQDILQTLPQLTATPETSTSWVRDAHLRTLPGANFPGDGFFAACFERIQP